MFSTMKRWCTLGTLWISAGSALGCGDGGSSDPAEALVSRFPGEATHVLEGTAAFVPKTDGFSASAQGEEDLGFLADEARPHAGMRALVPLHGDEPVRFELPGGAVIRVWEQGAYGEARIAGRAVAFAREQGSSFWSAVDGGYEEWLHLERGAAWADRPVASWRVEGATLLQLDDAVAAVGDEGEVLLRVTAPRAYAAGGREVAVRLEVREGRMELSADAGGEEVLIDPFWSAAAPLNLSRTVHTATLLPDGQVLVAGGAHYSDGWKATASCEIYDPKIAPAGSWTTSASLSLTYPRWSHTATLLQCGKVLVTGGWSGAASRRTVEIYDPALKDWLAVPSMVSPRHAHTATLLQDGHVLVVGGLDGSTMLKSVEIYDPISNTWSAGPPLATARAHHTATLLPNGRVLVAGGGKGNSVTRSAEIYDPAVNGWSLSTLMVGARHSHTATLLPNGKVLVAGGHNGSVYLKTAELFDSASFTWAPAPPMFGARAHHTATWFNGTSSVLVAGGSNGSSYLKTAELYSPVTGWSNTASMATGRDHHTATPIIGGRVLVAGGHASSTVATKTAELFNP